MRLLKRFLGIFFVFIAISAVVIAIFHFFPIWFGVYGGAAAFAVIVSGFLAFIIAMGIEYSV